jgi:putative aldouronate transport system permease protein
MNTLSKKKKKDWRTIPLMMLALPGLIYLLINNYVPMVGIFIAFKDIDYSKGIFASDWIGLKNFEFLFRTKDAFIMTRNTILYNLVFIALGTIIAIFIAIIMCEIIKLSISKIYQAGMILPSLVSMVIVSYLVYAFLNADSGFINNSVLKALGKSSVNWYSEPQYWPFILVIVNIWKNVGYSAIIYMASISGIDPGLYEAAKIDGAGKIRQIFSITLPMLKPIVIMLLIMAVGKIFNSDFGLFYQVPMNSGALYSTTQTIDTYVYRALMQLSDIGMSSAAGLYQSVVGFILVLATNALVKKSDKDSALF